MAKKQSAKDLAFEKERSKFRSEIRKLTDCLNDKEKQIDGLNETVREKDEVIRQQEEWIFRLLEYTELSKEELQNLIESEKDKAKIRESVTTTLGILGMVGRRY